MEWKEIDSSGEIPAGELLLIRSKEGNYHVITRSNNMPLIGSLFTHYMIIEEPLKSCPFCGSEAEIYQGPNSYYVECSEVCVRASMQESVKEAIKFWNKRV